MPAKITGLVKRGDIWHYDFRLQGNRFHGSTEFAEREKAERRLAEIKAEKSEYLKQLNGAIPWTFGMAATTWWQHKGQHRKDRKDVFRFIEWMQIQIGPKRALSTIDNQVVAQLVAKRRAEGVKAGTVNRSITEPMRAILRYAEFLEQPVKRINWREHLLKEDAERVREMSADEEQRLFAAFRQDFLPIIKFLLSTGIRRAEACNLVWNDVDMNTATMTVRGKGGTVDRRPLPKAAMAILQGELGNHPTRVFTYVVKRHEFANAPLGSRVPICPDTLSTAYWRARKNSGVTDLRLHDIRHTTASRVVRKTGNLMAASKALGHKRITTTQRYAHLAAEDVRAALDAAASPTIVPQDKQDKAAND
jgi:integrase